MYNEQQCNAETSNTKKSEPTLPESQTENKKNRVEFDLIKLSDLPPLPESQETSFTASEHDDGSIDEPSGLTSIAIPTSEMKKLQEMLKEMFQGEMVTFITDIVNGVLKGLQENKNPLSRRKTAS